MTVRRFVGIAAALAAGALAGAEEPRITARLDRPVIPYTEPAILTVEVRHAPDATVTFGPIEDADGSLTIHPPETARHSDETGTVTRLTCEIEGLEEGRYALKPLALTWADGRTESAPLPGLHIRPLSAAEQQAAATFAESYGMFEGPPSGGNMAVWLAAAAGVLAGAAAMAWWLLRRKRARTFEPPRAPWEIAYERLAALERAGLAERGAADAYYVHLSDIARQYIEARLALHAPERTTPEFLHEASSSGKLRAEHEALLARFMRRADRVKFARYAATSAEMAESFAEIRRFVDETVPKEPAGPDREAAA